MEYSPRQRAALLTLMAMGREVSNNELDEVAHFRLDGKDRERLNKLDLVASHKSGRVLVHVLTKKGWDWCREHLTSEAPRPAGSPLVGALYAVLAGLHRSRVDIETVFGGDAGRGVIVEPPTLARQQDAESLIRDAYYALVREPSGFVNLADVRAHLEGVPRAAVDTALRNMIRQPDVVLIPESDQSALRKRDREAAVRIGGEDKHLLSIER